jgi:transposase-like protein
MTDRDQDRRTRAVKHMAAGHITISEAASLCDVDRQLAYYWAKAARIDVNAARQTYIKKIWQRGK